MEDRSKEQKKHKREMRNGRKGIEKTGNRNGKWQKKNRKKKLTIQF